MQFEHHALSDPLGLLDEVDALAAHRTVFVGRHGISLEREVLGDDRVLEAGEEHRRTGIALTPRASAQLAVEAFGVVAARSDDAQPAEFDDVVVGVRVVLRTTQADVGAPSGHLGGHGDGVPGAGLGDDLRLFGVVLRVEHDRRHPGLVEEVRELLGLGHVVGTDEDGLSGLVDLLDVGDDRLDLVCLGVVDPVGQVGPDVGGVRRDLRDAQFVELAELLAGGERGAGHAADLRVAADQGLHRDGVDDLTRIGLGQPFLELDRGLDPVGPALELRDAAARGVDEVHAAVADDVVDVAFEEIVGVHGDADVYERRADVFLAVEVDAAEFFLDEHRTLVGQGDVAALRVDLVVLVLHPRHDVVDRRVRHLGLGRTGEHQRHERLVDEHRIRLVDDGHVGCR